MLLYDSSILAARWLEERKAAVFGWYSAAQIVDPPSVDTGHPAFVVDTIECFWVLESQMTRYLADTGIKMAGWRSEVVVEMVEALASDPTEADAHERHVAIVVLVELLKFVQRVSEVWDELVLAEHFVEVPKERSISGCQHAAYDSVAAWSRVEQVV